MNSQCNMNNCRNHARDTEPFCWQHRVKAKHAEHLLSLLKRSREYVSDSLEAHEHSDGRELLSAIDESLMPDALYCFAKTEQTHPTAPQGVSTEETI